MRLCRRMSHASTGVCTLEGSVASSTSRLFLMNLED
jgi:hypothetical protein